MSDKFKEIIESVDKYYTGKVQDHGASFKGMDWNSRESQELRFDQLLKLCDHENRFSIIDYGCGCGDLFGYIQKKALYFKYLGLDISEAMVKKAQEAYPKESGVRFAVGETTEEKADYVVASGIFNVKLDSSEQLWEDYILRTLGAINALSTKGFSFNSLTSYSDKEFMREDLFYADPRKLFDYCKRNFSRNVALLHDYELYEFTIIVRK